MLDTGSRMLMFRPYGEYPIKESSTEIIIALLVSETESGFKMDERSIALDRDEDGKLGRDFEYPCRVVK